ncbi:MAG: hypothetical protein AB8B65_16080 [Kordia sp.]|uniref:hypothetical protein n=1 Tax=Kordia sp. TaxID=1965332 RepID=UPI00385B87F0
MKKPSSKITTLLLLFFVLQSYGQQLEELKKQYEKEIIGIWQSQDDPNYKVEYTKSGKMKEYIIGEKEVYIQSYLLKISCGKINPPHAYNIYLKMYETQEEKEDHFCGSINNIHKDGKGIITLSITSERGKLELYTKVN